MFYLFFFPKTRYNCKSGPPGRPDAVGRSSITKKAHEATTLEYATRNGEGLEGTQPSILTR